MEVDLRMGENIGRAFKIADEGNTRASNITYNASNITQMGDSVGRYSMGCGAGRAYIGIGDDGSTGEGDEGSEGTDGRLPLYKKMAHTTE
jgi:hypothetical protein